MPRVHLIGITFFGAAALSISAPTPAFAQAVWQPHQETKSAALKWESEALKWEIAYQVLNAVDAAQTIYVIESGRGVEANSVFGKRPKPAVIIGAKALWGVAHFIGVREITKKNPKLGLRIAQISVIGQGTVVGLNARFVF